MKRKLIILLVIIVYLSSVFYNRWWFSIVYSRDGIRQGETMDPLVIFFTFTPFANTVAAINNLFMSPYSNRFEPTVNPAYLFNIKK